MIENKGNYSGSFGGESGRPVQFIDGSGMGGTGVFPSTPEAFNVVFDVDHKVYGATHSSKIVLTADPSSMIAAQAFNPSAETVAALLDNSDASGSGMLPPVTTAPTLEAYKHHDPRPRSPLRDGTALDGLVPDRPLVNSLLERSDLRKVEPPIKPSRDYTRCDRFLRQLKLATDTVMQCDLFELGAIARVAITPLHRPKVKEISDRKLPSRIPSDPIDPVMIFVEAIPLAHRVLHQDASGKNGLDLDGVAYIVERLNEAEGLRTQPQDVRFDVLQALSDFLVAILEKAEEECWACVEAA